MTELEALYDRLSNEFETFRSSILKQSPEEIFGAAYEITCKQELVYMLAFYLVTNMVDAESLNEDATVLNRHDVTLDELYRHAWLDYDDDFSDLFSSAIGDYVLRLIESEKEN